MKTIRHALLLLAAVAVSCGKEQPPAAAHPPMRVARNLWPGQYWADLAWKKGWFAEEGLSVDAVNTNRDYYASIDDLVAGRLDAQMMPLHDVLVRNLHGADLVVVIAGDYAFSDSIVARPGIDSPTDLAGKTVAVTPDSYQEYVLDHAMRLYGLTIADVKLEPVALKQSGKALTGPDVAAVVTCGIFTDEAIASGGKRIFSTAEIPELMPDVWVVRREFLERRRADVEAFVAVWGRTTEWLMAHHLEALTLVAQANGRNVADVERGTDSVRILDLKANRVAFTYAAGPESLHGAAQQMNRFLIQQKKTDRYLDTTSFIDHRFVRRVR